jgi:hypothetical protein
MDEPFVEPAVVHDPVTPPEATEQRATPATTQPSGLAGAIARSREVKQELEKTRRQQAQAQGVRRI